ncbi:MAG: hypothetical protein OXI36_05810 [Gammaproteobacteria bacterium]|nr:hypothetical protein [Gammaproteobacteria bacterium]MDE0402928.1 hypothetical protein [Gammaproteobacteria bacterium]
MTTQNYVGIIQTSSGCQIEILPKISKSMSQACARSLLVKMLVKLQDSPFKESTLADIDPQKMSLFELVFSLFLSRVREIIQTGIVRQYVDQQGNLVFLRGKLQFYEHIRRNCIERSRFYCEYDEYELNHPINRLMKLALSTVSKLSKSSINLQTCNEYLHWFDHVPESHDFRTDFRAIKQDRFVQHYEKALPIAKLILEQMNPLTVPGQHSVFSMLFNMNRVFEDYVAAKLDLKMRGWQINKRVARKYLVDEHNNQKNFLLIPDLELTHVGDNQIESRRVIADTKWKLINEKNPYDLTETDLYQMFTYAKKYLVDQLVKVVVLIYPATDNFKSPLNPFWFDQHRTEVLLVLPFDLQNDQLVVPQDLKNFDW